MLYIVAAALAVSSALGLLACRLLPGLADGWMRVFFAPVVSAFSRIASLASFPVAEPAALLLLALLIYLLVRSRRGACLLLFLIFGVYALLWAPAYFVTPRYLVTGEVEAEALAAACRDLIAELNAGQFQMPEDLPARALAAAALADTPAEVASAPKYARYPEWMRALKLAGLYVPWTFEALIKPGGAEAGLPFTAVHELMHLGGVADEGQANIFAYEACLRAGGAFAYSARLWALKYALGALRDLDADAWNDCASRLSEDARENFRRINGFAAPASARGSALEALLRLGGISEKTASYEDLAAWLCAAHVSCMEA